MAYWTAIGETFLMNRKLSPAGAGLKTDSAPGLIQPMSRLPRSQIFTVAARRQPCKQP